MDNYNFTKFHQNQMKNKKVLLMALLTDCPSVKVPLMSCQGTDEFGHIEDKTIDALLSLMT